MFSSSFFKSYDTPNISKIYKGDYIMESSDNDSYEQKENSDFKTKYIFNENGLPFMKYIEENYIRFFENLNK